MSTTPCTVCPIHAPGTLGTTLGTPGTLVSIQVLHHYDGFLFEPGHWGMAHITDVLVHSMLGVI